VLMPCTSEERSPNSVQIRTKEKTHLWYAHGFVDIRPTKIEYLHIDKIDKFALVVEKGKGERDTFF
jgi:hypothetical protein